MDAGKEVSVVRIGESPPATFWKNRGVFVTGVTGLLGSWLVEARVQRQAQVTCLIRDWVPGSRLIGAGFMAQVNLVHGELEDYAVLVRALNEYEMEDTPLQGRFPYDVSKSCADLIAVSYLHTYALPVAVTRCGNLFGGGDLNFNRRIPGTIYAVFHDQPPVIRSDGKFIGDYFYVRDAVQAYLTLAERLPDDRFLGQAFSFGTETPIAVLDLVGRILALLDKTSLTPQVLNEATREIPRQYLDWSKAWRMLGWQAQYTLEHGLRETIAWYRQWRSRAICVGVPNLSVPS